MKIYNEEDITIMMLDGKTRKECIKYLEKGSIVYEDLEENFDFYMQGYDYTEEEVTQFKRMIKDKIPLNDWSIVEYNGKTYYIEYVL